MTRPDYIVGIKAGTDGAVACLDSQLSLRWAFDMPVATRGGRRGVDGAELARLLRENLPRGAAETRAETLDFREHDALMTRVAPGRAPGSGTAGKALTVVYLEYASVDLDLGAARSFNLGLSRGVVEGVLAALKMPVESIFPGVWRKGAGLLNKDRDALLVLAKELYPEVALIHRRDAGKAQAMLIARFGGLEKHEI